MKIGYARVSTKDQELETQRTRLEATGCEIFFEEKISGVGVDSGRGQNDTLSALAVPFDDVRDGVFRDAEVLGDPSV